MSNYLKSGMVAAVTALVLVLVQSGSALAAAAGPAAVVSAGNARKFVPPKVQKVPALPRTLDRVSSAGAAARAGVTRAVQAELAAGRAPQPDSSWPVPGSALVALPRAAAQGMPAAAVRAAGAPVPAGRLPVELARAAGQGNLSGLRVSVLPHQDATAAGVAGMVFTVAAAHGAAGRVGVSVNYASFAHASGGNFGQRLRLVELPACALTSPRLHACQVATALRSVNNGRTQQVSAAAALGSGRRPDVVMAVEAGPSGPSGDFTATSLRPSDTWTAGGSSGDFTWSYPIAVPPAAAGPGPQVSLDYDSASADGQTAQTDNQSSEVGEGFTLDDNYIERTYTDCADDPEGAISGDYDNCWAGNVVTLSLNGVSTPLVLDSKTSSWHEEQDEGDQVQYLTGTGANTNNGTYDNGYWVVTTPDGTEYYFGKNEGPGWAAGDPTTNSAWSEPVYGAHSGDPCNGSKWPGLPESFCPQAWRWNLDFVIDPNGNTTAYYYTPETNYYGAGNQTTGAEYDRDGYLTQIDYGLRDESGSIYGPLDKNPPDEVLFGTKQRCTPRSGFACDASEFTAANAWHWPDTPQDQQCLQGDTCNNHAPTFWSQIRINQITTEYYNGSGYTKVDVYQLGQAFPKTGDIQLQLDTITRTGYSAARTSLPLPRVNLKYQLMNNRIPGYNKEPSMAEWRLTDIETETGEVIGVTYSSQCTAAGIPSSPSANTTLCYPVYWAEEGDTNLVHDWFNKYVVKDVTVQDGTAGDPEQLTEYDYTAGLPAWHYDDNQVIKAADRTYGQFRGYSKVKVLTGNPQNDTNGSPDVQTMTETTYYQGMYGDTLPGDGTSTNQVEDSLGQKFTDTDALAGLPLEVQTFDGSTSGTPGAQLTDTITEQSVLDVTATEPVTGLPTMRASMIGVATEVDYTDLAGGGQHELTTTTSYDSDGRPVLVDKSGTGIPETCTQTTYDDSTSPGVWIRDAVSEVITAQQACPSSAGNLTAADIVSDTRTYYDGATSLTTPPTAGNPTMETKAVTNNDGTLTFATQWTKTYDSSGRIATSTDGRNNTTTTAYTPADGGPVTKVTTTNALSQTSADTYDPGRGSLLTSTSTAGYLTSYSYDPLGWVTGVWEPGRTQGPQVSANITYSYLETQSQPLAVTTNTLVDTGTATDYVPSIAIYDSLGQLRQTQTAAEEANPGQPNTVVTDQFYDSHGWECGTNNKYVVSGSPSASLVHVAESDVNDRTTTSYNGAGQVTGDQDYNGTTLTDSTQTVQGGNQVTTIETDPSGTVIGTPSATVTNVLGQQTQTIQYAGAPSVSSSSVVSGGGPQVTTMSYDPAGDKTGVTDPASNTWSYTYNLLGEQVKAVSPDSGTTLTGYDQAGNVAYVTDANGTSVNFSYDALNRKTAEYTGSTTQGDGTEIATWVWDTLKKGLLSYETSITPSGTYQTGNVGYDPYGNVSGTYVSVPKGQPLAGNYETQYVYSSTGLLQEEHPASGGGLPPEALTWTYDQYGNPTSENGYDTYVNGASYTPYNEISQIELGTGSSAGALTYSYDPQTRNITGISLSDNQPGGQVDNTAYDYNADQQITSITDTQGATGSAPVETQCFGYDGLSRLTQAWTSTDNCADDPAKTGNSTVGGPQPYWQSWTYDQLGDIQSQTSYAPAGSTAGNNTTSYGYGVSGHVHAIASTTTTNSVTGASTTTGYAYNPDGETTSLGSQSLTWNDNGTLATVGNTSYVYDADGNELTQTTPSGATLFLPGEEISTGSTGTTGVRYYTFDGKTIALSTGTTLDWTEANPQGTLTAAVNAFPNPTGTQFIPIYRTLTPYGTVLTGSGEGTWPDNRTFLNDTDNTTTGLIDIGARKYNPATATFISVDPLLDTSNPQTMTGYTYSADDPINSEDPSGEYAAGPSHDGGYCEGSAQYCSGVSSRQQQANQQQYNQVSSAIENQDLEDCGCHFATQQAMASEWQSPAFAAQMVANYVATVEYDQRILAQAEAREEAQQQAQSHHNWFAAGLLALGAVALTVVNAVQLGADPLTDSAEAIDVGALVDTVVDDDTTVADDGADDPVEQGCGESFTAGTKVLLASGAAIPISRLRPGEKVLATNTRTGKTAPETVTAVMEKRDTDRYDLTIRSGPRTAVIDTTRNHLFWDVSQDRWVQAGALKNGNHLRTPDGATATVAGGHAPADTAGSMWDLSVPGGGDHDFYIDVIHTAVLVHNCPAFKSKYPFPKLQQCVISGLTILHLMNPATTAHGEMVLGNPPSYSMEIDNENPAPGTGAPPVPGGDGDGGGSGDGGEC